MDTLNTIERDESVQSDESLQSVHQVNDGGGAKSRYHVAALAISLRQKLIALAVCALVAVSSGCGSAYKDAVERGDKYAAAGQYDKAVAEYERAAELDPDDPEAAIKLEKLQKRRANDQLEAARSFEQRGEIEKALSSIHAAAKLQPDDLAINKELARLETKVIGQADELLADDKPAKALELTTLVLKGSPRHTKALSIDREARAELAARAFDRGRGFSQNEQHGNALVEYAAALSYQAKMPEAKLAFGEAKLRLEKELKFVVVLSPFTGGKRSAYLTKALTPAILGQSIDERLLIDVTRASSAKREDSTGVAVGGRFSGYSYRRDRRSEQRSCDYVCGTDTKPNPRRADAERSLGQAEQRLAPAEEKLSRKQKEIGKYEKRIADEQRDLDREQQDLDKKRERYDRCMEKVDPEDSFPCSSEKSNLESAQRDVDRARRDLDSPRRDLERAREAVSRARDSRDRIRGDVDRARQRLRDTPTTIEVERTCAFSYSIAIHDVASSVQMNLTLVGTDGGPSMLTDEPFRYNAGAKDTTFPAHPGRCREVASGNPLDLPPESKLREKLLAKVVTDIRGKVVTAYDSYRSRFLSVARKHESAGMTEQAVESYVRYVLTGPHKLKDAKAIGAFLRKARGFGKLETLTTL